MTTMMTTSATPRSSSPRPTVAVPTTSTVAPSPGLPVSLASTKEALVVIERIRAFNQTVTKRSAAGDLSRLVSYLVAEPEAWSHATSDNLDDTTANKLQDTAVWILLKQVRKALGPGSIEAIRAMHDAGHTDIEFITAAASAGLTPAEIGAIPLDLEPGERSRLLNQWAFLHSLRIGSMPDGS